MSGSGVEAWKEHTTPFERVQAIALGVSEPQSATYIADEAAVSVETARKHLNSLVELTVVLEHETGNQTKYEPDPLYTWLQTARDLLDSHNRESLVNLRDEVQTQIETWREEYDVDSPDALREHAADTESAAETREICQIASDWELTEYRLNIITDVCSNYSVYNRG